MSAGWLPEPTTRDARGGERAAWRRFAWRTDGMGILALLLVTLAAAAQNVRGGVLIGQDSATQFYPWFDYLGERLRAGDIPGWNPYQFAGVPFAADPQSGWMYLPAMLVFSLLPLASAVPVFIVFHLALAGTGTYALARLLGIGIGGALVAGVTYQLATPIYGRTVCCPAQYEVGAWMPLALVGAEVGMRSGGWPWRIIGWAIAGLAVSQALGAWLGQGGYYFLLFLAAWVGYRGLIAPSDRDATWPRRVRDTALHGGAILTIGFGLAAAGILPRLDYVGRSNVAGGEYGEENAWASEIGGVTPGMLVDRMLDPTLYYPGTAVLLLAVAAVVLSGDRHATRFFATAGICAIVLAMPWDTPLHVLLYLVLPRFEQLHQHWPDRVAIVGYLCFAMLAASAVESLVSRRFETRRLLVAIGVPAVALLALVVANADIPVAPIVALILTFGLVASLARPAAARWLQPVLPVALAAILVFDHLAAFQSAVTQGPYGGFHRVDLGTYYAPGGAATFLRERMATSPGRYIGFDPAQRAVADGQLVLYRYQFAAPDTGALLVNNRGVLHGVEDAQGYNPVQPRHFVEYLTALNGHPQEYHDANVYPAGIDSPLLDLLNIRYIVIPATYPEDRDDLRELDRAFPTIYADDQVQVLENPEALPRAWIVHEARQVEPEAALPLLATGSVDPRQVALLETAPPPLGTPSDPAASSVRVIHDEPDVMRLATAAEAPGLLVLSETYDPHWRATVDGEDVEIIVANHLFRAVPIPAGEHAVELRYEPDPLQVGLGISTVTVAVLVPALAWATWRIRSRGRHGPRRRPAS